MGPARPGHGDTGAQRVSENARSPAAFGTLAGLQWRVGIRVPHEDRGAFKWFVSSGGLCPLVGPGRLRRLLCGEDVLEGVERTAGRSAGGGEESPSAPVPDGVRLYAGCQCCEGGGKKTATHAVSVGRIRARVPPALGSTGLVAVVPCRAGGFCVAGVAHRGAASHGTYRGSCARPSCVVGHVEGGGQFMGRAVHGRSVPISGPAHELDVYRHSGHPLPSVGSSANAVRNRSRSCWKGRKRRPLARALRPRRASR